MATYEEDMITALNSIVNGTGSGGSTTSGVNSLITATNSLITSSNLTGTNVGSLLTINASLITAVQSLITAVRSGFGTITATGTTFIQSSFTPIATGGTTGLYGISISEASSVAGTLSMFIRYGQLDTSPVLWGDGVLTASGTYFALAPKPIAVPNGVRVTILAGQCHLTLFTT